MTAFPPEAAQRGIKVDVQQQLKADFTLVPGSVKEEVFVTAAVSLLQTQDASVGTLASRAQINDLPLNGRNYTFLAQLGPGVTGLSATRGLDKNGSFVANGLSSVHNSFRGQAYDNLPQPSRIRSFRGSNDSSKPTSTMLQSATTMRWHCGGRGERQGGDVPEPA